MNEFTAMASQAACDLVFICGFELMQNLLVD